MRCCTATAVKSTVKNYFFCFVLLIISLIGFAQPTISTFAPFSGPAGTIVTITGNGFSPVPANNIVFFGAVKATVQNATTSSLTVVVPKGATYKPVSVTTSQLTAYSAKPFLLTFPGGNTISGNSFDNNKILSTDLRPQAVVFADLDGDGLADLATANNYSINGQPASMSVLRNKSVQKNVAFDTAVNINSGILTYTIAAGDLDGDGLPELVSTSIADQTIAILKNTSSQGNISFAAKVQYATGSSPYSIGIADFNGDGRPDLAVANFTANTVSVFKNTSTGSTISFASKLDFTTGLSPVSLEVADLDGDGKTDIAVANQQSGSVSIFKNSSTGGNISFAGKVDFGSGNYPLSIAIGDLDNDGKADIVVSNYTSSTFSVLKNNGAAGVIGFAAARSFPAELNPYGISIGDLNGDGLPDLAINAQFFSVFQNTSTSANISFSTASYVGGLSNTIHSALGDLDNDGKPDIAAGNYIGQNVFVVRNRNNEPYIASFSPATATTGTTVTITGANFTNASGVRFGDVPASSFTIISPTTITAIVDSGASGDVKVINAYGDYTKPGFNFVGPPSITSFTPATANQQTVITITGKNFTGTTGVTFGGVAATSFTIVSSTSITAVAGNGASGAISVTNPYGTATATGFTYIPPPTISSLSPATGQAGTAVTITGTNFNGATDVKFGGSAVQSFSVLSSTSISAIIADGASGYIEVSTFGGKATSSTMFMFSAPTISSFSPTSGNAGTMVTINGTNFRSNPSDNVVYFGAVKATVSAATNNKLSVIVPPGTTDQPITVTANSYTSYSNQPFILTYDDGNSGITSSSFTWKAAFGTHDDPRGLCLSDFDGDGRNDIAVQNYFDGSIDVLKNTSSNQSVSFAPKQYVASGFGTNTSVAIGVGDIDGDGKPDIVITAGISISIFKNTSQGGSISFAPKIDLPGDYFNQGIAIGDFDEDGKPDIAVTSRDFATSNTKISIYRNTSGNGVISFATRVQFNSPDYAGPLVTTDFDGDGKADLAALPISAASVVATWRNTSSKGNISFTSFQSFPTGNSPSYLTLGDLNGDGAPELLTSNYYDSTFSVLKNTSNIGTISFASKIDYRIEGAPTYITLGQLDGDGKLDLAVVNDNKKIVSIFRNTSNSSTISFTSKVDYTTQLTYNWMGAIVVGDIDGDGKPDMCVANSADNKISFFKNRESKKTIGACSSSANLTSNLTGSTYQWQVNTAIGFTNLSNGSIYSGVTTSTLQLSNIPLNYNNYEYRCLVDGNSSDVFVINVTQSVTPAVTISASATNICTGTPVTFTTTSTNGGNTPIYQWQVNNINVGTNSSVFTSSSLSNNDQVKVIMTSNANCITTPLATSTAITVAVTTPIKILSKASSPSQACTGTSYNVTFTSSNTPNGSSVQLWVNSNNGIFTSGSTQSYNGIALNFAITDNSSGTKKYFFKTTPPASSTCIIGNNSDTSATLVDQIAKPILSVNASTITVTNLDVSVGYTWQIQNTGNWSDVVPSASGTSYTVVNTGSYRVKATKGQCSEYSDALSVTITGVNTIPSSQNIALYPNPTQGTLTLDSLKLTDNWEILDIVSSQTGQTVATFNIANRTKVTIQVDALSNGVYLAVLRRKDGSLASIKFLKA